MKVVVSNRKRVLAAAIPERARLDADRTARPRTRIVSHPHAEWCVGPGTVLVDPEYEDAFGERTSLVTS